ncbi:hypothetical protein [Microbacterium sp. USHLN272]|uniref:hypothetical protein n=1 Tax=Microbacterium sp. USHLN272 TaxID=3081287 RepID=UPI003015B451
MDYLTNEIREATRVGLWHVALQASLAAIDICAALNSEDGRTTGARFKQWAADWIGSSPIHPDYLWQLRCGILHEGRLKETPSVVFTVPLKAGWVVHQNSVDGVQQVDLLLFCNEICTKIESWWELSKEREPVATNAMSLVRERPDGLPGFGNAVRVIA